VVFQFSSTYSTYSIYFIPKRFVSWRKSTFELMHQNNFPVLLSNPNCFVANLSGSPLLKKPLEIMNQTIKSKKRVEKRGPVSVLCNKKTCPPCRQSKKLSINWDLIEYEKNHIHNSWLTVIDTHHSQNFLLKTDQLECKKLIEYL